MNKESGNLHVGDIVRPLHGVLTQELYECGTVHPDLSVVQLRKRDDWKFEYGTAKDSLDVVIPMEHRKELVF